MKEMAVAYFASFVLLITFNIHWDDNDIKVWVMEDHHVIENQEVLNDDSLKVDLIKFDVELGSTVESVTSSTSEIELDYTEHEVFGDIKWASLFSYGKKVDNLFGKNPYHLFFDFDRNLSSNFLEKTSLGYTEKRNKDELPDQYVVKDNTLKSVTLDFPAITKDDSDQIAEELTLNYGTPIKFTDRYTWYFKYKTIEWRYGENTGFDAYLRISLNWNYLKNEIEF